MNLKNIIEKQNNIWVIVAGIALIVFGFYYYNELKTMEDSGREIRLNMMFYFIYKTGGKLLVLAITECIGIFLLIGGILQLKSKE